MKNAAARNALDRQLKAHGQAVTLKRLTPVTLAVVATATIRAHIRDFTPQEIQNASNLQNGMSKVIVAQADLDAKEWPSIPRKGDILVAAGRERVVIFAWPGPYIEDKLVRIELAVE